MAHIIQITRKWETESSTLSELSIPDAKHNELKQDYMLERPGPDTTLPGYESVSLRACIA